MKMLSMMVVTAILLHGRVGHAEAPQQSWLQTGRQAIKTSLSMARVFPMDNEYESAEWGAGLALSYGYFATAWLEAEAQLQVGLMIAEMPFRSGWGLAGASAYFYRGPQLAAFAGLRLGLGAFWEGDSDGGLEELRRTVIVAPRAGILLKLTDTVDLQASLEYQAAFVSTETKYEYGSRHIIQLPVGVVFAF